MMNLDELKVQLKKQLNNEAVSSKTVEDLQIILRAKTKSITQKLVKSLWFEIIFSVVFLFIFGLIAFLASNQALKIYFGFFSIFSLVFAFILYFLLQKTIALSSASLAIKVSLEKLHATLSEFVKRYFQFTMGLIPICFGLSISLGINDNSTNVFTPDNLKNNFVSIAIICGLVIYIIVFTFAMYKFTKWYLKKLYGKYLDELKTLIEELEN